MKKRKAIAFAGRPANAISSEQTYRSHFRLKWRRNKWCIYFCDPETKELSKVASEKSLIAAEAVCDKILSGLNK